MEVELDIHYVAMRIPNDFIVAMRYFYEELGDRLWGEYGFKDAFNLTEDWFAPSYLAIDQDVYKRQDMD